MWLMYIYTIHLIVFNEPKFILFVIYFSVVFFALLTIKFWRNFHIVNYLIVRVSTILIGFTSQTHSDI